MRGLLSSDPNAWPLQQQWLCSAGLLFLVQNTLKQGPLKVRFHRRTLRFPLRNGLGSLRFLVCVFKGVNMVGGKRLTSVAAIVHVTIHHGTHFNLIAIVTQLALLHDAIATNRLGAVGGVSSKTVFGAAGVAGVWCRRVR